MYCTDALTWCCSCTTSADPSLGKINPHVEEIARLSRQRGDRRLPGLDSQAGQPALFLEILQKPAGAADYSRTGTPAEQKGKKRVWLTCHRDSQKNVCGGGGQSITIWLPTKRYKAGGVGLEMPSDMNNTSCAMPTRENKMGNGRAPTNARATNSAVQRALQRRAVQQRSSADAAQRSTLHIAAR